MGTLPGAKRRNTATVIAVLTFVLLAIVGSGKSAAAQQPWNSTTAESLSAGGTTFWSDLDVGADGTSAVIWSETDQGFSRSIRVRTRVAGGSFGPTQTLARGAVFSPRVAVSANGSVVAVWMSMTNPAGSMRIQASLKHRGGAFSHPVTISNPAFQATEPELDIGPNGKAFLVWIESGGETRRLGRAVVRPDGSHDLLSSYSDGIGEVRTPRIDIGSNGQGAVVWESSGYYDSPNWLLGDSNTWVPQKRSPIRLLRFNSADENSSQVTVLSWFFRTPGCWEGKLQASSNSQPDVEVSDDGMIVAVWRNDYGSERYVNGCHGIGYRKNDAIEGRTVWPDGTFGPITWLGIGGPVPRNPQVTIGSDTTTTVAWADGNNDGSNSLSADPGRILVTTRPAGGGFYPRAGRVKYDGVIASNTKGLDAPVLSSGADGTTTIAWLRNVNGGGAMVDSKTRLPGQSFGQTTTLTSPGVLATYLDLELDDSGRATAIWRLGGGNGTATNVQSRSTPATEYSVTVRRAGAGTGRVVSSPGGIDCGVTCQSNYSGNQEVVLYGQPEAGSTLVGWEGPCASQHEFSCTVPAGQASEVTALFEPAEQLSLSRSGPGQGLVTGSSGLAEIDCGSDCEAEIERGETMTLVAKPTTGYSFAGWSGDCQGLSRSCAVLMNDRRKVEARFTKVQVLTVARGGDGTGSVVSSVPGIDCGSACRAVVEPGERISLTAVPDAGSVFSHWGGVCTGSSVSCEVTVDQDGLAIAYFIGSYPLSVGIQSAGLGRVAASIGTLECSVSRCRGSFALGSEVTLTPVSGAAAAFTGWSGCETVIDNGGCVVSMDAPVEVTAHFEPGEQFSVGFVGGGSGRVLSDPVAVNCHGGAGDLCEHGFLSGSEVTLTAMPDPGSVFVGWVKGDPADFTGGCEGTGLSCVSRVGLPVRVTARFDLAPEPEPEVEPDAESPDDGGSEGCEAPDLQVSQLKRSGGAATLKLKAPRAGSAVITGRLVIKTRVKLLKAGWTRVNVKPTTNLARKLKARKTADTRVTVRYLMGEGCEPALTRARVTFKG